jgi:hypothetical protein
MTTDDLIRALCSWAEEPSQHKNEHELHRAVLAKLGKMNLHYCDEPRLPNPGASGLSKPDILVTDVTPQLLIEIKATGSWKHASQAAWQLFQAAELLQRDGTETRNFAIFGGKISDPIMLKMLNVLGVEWGCVQM